MKPIAIPSALLDEVYAHARAVFPVECCGYLVGARGGDAVDATVPCTNLVTRDPIVPGRGADTAFAIGGAELLAFARSFTTERPARIVYHSHTNGRAYFSASDRAVAATPAGPSYPVQHLVVGVTAAEVTEAVQVAWSADASDFVEIARWSISSRASPSDAPADRQG
jgi:proteasome lid subunit RPN8/RPN11